MTTCDGVRRRRGVAAAVFAVALVSAGAAWIPASPGFAWSFPRDHWAHPGYRTEWWYFTGHLEAADEPSARFGYQFTVFRVGVLPERPSLDSAWAASNVIMAHAAVTDVRAGTHRFADVLRREMPLLGAFAPPSGDPIAWVAAPAGTPGRWDVRWNGEAFDFSMRDDRRRMAFALRTRPLKPPVLEGPGGLSRKGEDATAASLYYSFTRLQTDGTLSLDGRTWRVRGESWMDKEFGSSQLSARQVGWDWFSLQLADGRDLMLYVLRRADGSPDHRSGTRVSVDGTPRWLGEAEWSVASTGSWKSPATGAVYPAGWTVVLPSEGIRLTVTPSLADQENVGEASGGVFYWEGAVAVTDPAGAPCGRGYVELTGYGPSSRPPI